MAPTIPTHIWYDLTMADFEELDSLQKKMVVFWVRHTVYRNDGKGEDWTTFPTHYLATEIVCDLQRCLFQLNSVYVTIESGSLDKQCGMREMWAFLFEYRFQEKFKEILKIPGKGGEFYRKLFTFTRVATKMCPNEECEAVLDTDNVPVPHNNSYVDNRHRCRSKTYRLLG
jgi:hypothetical protein